MGWRFRRSIKIFPGVKININKDSTSISVGGRGFHKTYSSTGRVTTSVGIPGTGLSYTTTTNPARTVSGNSTVSSSYMNTTNSQNDPSQPQVPSVNINAIRAEIMSIYRDTVEKINWKQILIAPEGTYPAYFKSKVDKVYNGDIDTYFEVLTDINPFDRLIQYGSDFEVGTDDPRMISVHFNVNSQSVLNAALTLPNEQYNDLLQDYVCGCAIRLARDVFALLPVRHVEIVAIDGDKEILVVDFQKNRFESIDFGRIDASDTVEMFDHKMKFTLAGGFQPLV